MGLQRSSLQDDFINALSLNASSENLRSVSSLHGQSLINDSLKSRIKKNITTGQLSMIYSKMQCRLGLQTVKDITLELMLISLKRCQKFLKVISVVALRMWGFPLNTNIRMNSFILAK